MREFTINENGSIITCWTTDSPKFGFRFDTSNRMAQYCLTVIHEEPLDTVTKMKYLDMVLADFLDFAKVHFPTVFYEPKPRCGIEEVQLR